MSLINAKVLANAKHNEKQIFVEAGSSQEERDILFEASTVELATEWSLSIEQHCTFATARNTMRPSLVSESLTSLMIPTTNENSSTSASTSKLSIQTFNKNNDVLVSDANHNIYQNNNSNNNHNKNNNDSKNSSPDNIKFFF
jgi:hypothetical protein